VAFVSRCESSCSISETHSKNKSFIRLSLHGSLALADLPFVGAAAAQRAEQLGRSLGQWLVPRQRAADAQVLESRAGTMSRLVSTMIRTCDQ
jgi:hypothetical protein